MTFGKIRVNGPPRPAQDVEWGGCQLLRLPRELGRGGASSRTQEMKLIHSYLRFPPRKKKGISLGAGEWGDGGGPRGLAHLGDLVEEKGGDLVVVELPQPEGRVCNRERVQ